MKNFKQPFLQVILSSGIVLVTALIFPLQGEAELRFRISGKTLVANEKTSKATLATIARAVESGKAKLITKRSSGKPRLVSINRANKKDIALLQNILANLAALSFSSQQSNGIEPPETSFTTVFKVFTINQCNYDPADIVNDLPKRGIPTINAGYCAIPSSKESAPLKCGEQAEVVRVATVGGSQGGRAFMAGYRPMEWAKTRLTSVECDHYLDNTIEMVGSFSNISCRTTQNTVEQFDQRLAANGLEVLGAECGDAKGQDSTVCGRPITTFRLVKIKASQRPLALRLGLRPRNEFEGQVYFGVACPTPVIVEPPLNGVEMVGVIANISCNQPATTVESFDMMLRRAGVRVLNSSCGFDTASPAGIPCPFVYRVVMIPQEQEYIAYNLGLFPVSSPLIPPTVVYGQSCPL